MVLVAAIVGPIAATAPVPAHAAAPSGALSAVQLVVDVSGSMADDDGTGTIKLNGAKAAIIELLDVIPDGVNVGLRTYPADGADCGNDGAEGLEIADLEARPERGEVERLVRKLVANGGTPTDEALRAAWDDVQASGAASRGRATIVLVSDGESTCTTEPCDVARELARQGAQITVDTVGFQISEQGAEELNCIANATGGHYVEAGDADELADTLGQITNAALTLSVDAPEVVIRNNGHGPSASITGADPVTITATVANPSSVLAQNARVQIVATSTRKPALLQPVRQLGNLDVGDESQTKWSFQPPSDFADLELEFEVTVSASNAPAVSRRVTVKLTGSIKLADAGPLLRGRDRVVIMGDSYSAGEGGGDYPQAFDNDTNQCHRSPHTYGEDLWPKATQRVNIACSGAVIANLTTSQNPTAAPQLDQLDDLDEAPDLLLMSLGGNDAGFKDVVIGCILPGECHERRVITVVPCVNVGQQPGGGLAYLDGTDSAEVNQLLHLTASQVKCFADMGTVGDQRIAAAKQLSTQLVDAYLAIDEKLNSPRRLDQRDGEVAPIIVLTYPKPIPDATSVQTFLDACPENFTTGEWKWVTSFLDTLNAAVAQAVATARNKGVPIFVASQVATAFQPSHTFCDAEPYAHYLDGSDTIRGLGERLGLLGLRWSTCLFAGCAGLALPSTTEMSRNISEQFHPNVDGYKAMTAALVEFSNSDMGQLDVVRRRPRPLEALPLPPGPVIHIDDPTRATIERGTTVTVTADVAAGTQAVLTVNSDPVVVGLGTAGNDGTVTFVFELPANFPTGEHTLTVTSVSPSVPAGVPVSTSRAVRVGDHQSFWRRSGSVVALAATGVALVASAVAIVAFLLRRRRPDPERRRAVIA